MGIQRGKKKKAKEICEWLRIFQNEQTQKHTYRNLSEHQAGLMPPQNPTPTHHIQTAENRTESKQLERRGKYTIPTRRKDKNYMCSE